MQTVAQATDQSCTSDQARMLDLMKSVSLDKMEKVDQFKNGSILECSCFRPLLFVEQGAASLTVTAKS